MVSLVLIEGGGFTRDQQARLRQGFAGLFAKLLGNRPKPRVVCAGGGHQAFADFKHEVNANPTAACLLLIDSEGPVVAGDSPWQHVARRGGGWVRPDGVTDEQLHFMVEAMEAWLVADPEALAHHYGSEFKASKLPRQKNLEKVPKTDLLKALEAATKDVKTKGRYQKSHAFDLVGKLDPVKVRRACPDFAARFFAALEGSAAQTG